MLGVKAWVVYCFPNARLGTHVQLCFGASAHPGCDFAGWKFWHCQVKQLRYGRSQGSPGAQTAPKLWILR